MKYSGAVFAILLALVCRLLFVSVYKVPTQSMAPAIMAGDYVLSSQVAFGLKWPVNQQIYFRSEPRVGDLVVYNKGGKTFIKRILGKSGDSVEVTKSELWLNSKKCDYSNSFDTADSKFAVLTEKCDEASHSVLHSKTGSQELTLTKTTLMPGQFLAVGDNRSPDGSSTPLEIINYDQIVGKPLLIWLSYASTQDFISNSLGIRWNRILTIPN